MEDNEFGEETARWYDLVMEKGYHPQQAYIEELLRIVPEGSKVLELGCGTGGIMLPLLEHGVRVEGLDKSEAMIKRLKEKNSEAIVYHSALENFKLRRNRYDWTLSCNGPFQIRGNDLLSYILDENVLIRCLRSSCRAGRNGLLVAKGRDKPREDIDLGGGVMLHHSEERVGEYVFSRDIGLVKNVLQLCSDRAKKIVPMYRILEKGVMKVREYEHFIHLDF